MMTTACELAHGEPARNVYWCYESIISSIKANSSELNVNKRMLSVSQTAFGLRLRPQAISENFQPVNNIYFSLLFRKIHSCIFSPQHSKLLKTMLSPILKYLNKVLINWLKKKLKSTWGVELLGKSYIGLLSSFFLKRKKTYVSKISTLAGDEFTRGYVNNN